MVGRPPAAEALILDPAEVRFGERAIRRRRLFLGLAIAGVVIGLLLAGFTAYRSADAPAERTRLRVVLIVLILLNARQNLRQYRFAGILEKRGLG